MDLRTSRPPTSAASEKRENTVMTHTHTHKHTQPEEKRREFKTFLTFPGERERFYLGVSEVTGLHLASIVK